MPVSLRAGPAGLLRARRRKSAGCPRLSRWRFRIPETVDRVVLEAEEYFCRPCTFAISPRLQAAPALIDVAIFLHAHRKGAARSDRAGSRPTPCSACGPECQSIGRNSGHRHPLCRAAASVKCPPREAFGLARTCPGAAVASARKVATRRPHAAPLEHEIGAMRIGDARTVRPLHRGSRRARRPNAPPILDRWVGAGLN